MQAYFVYLVAVLLVAAGLLMRRSNRSRADSRNEVRAKHIKGNVQVGDNSGTINQTYTGSAGAAAPEVNWIDRGLVIAGVLIAAAQLAHDYHKK